LNILRTLQPSFAAIPNVTAFGSAGSLFAQLWYDGVEQFYCKADSCTQDSTSADWNCQNLQCSCIGNTTFCGGGGLDITQTINTLAGTVAVSCSALSSTNTATCNFTQTVLQSIFGASGLSLQDCIFGECVRQGVIDAATNSTSSTTTTTTSKQLSGGVIAGLAVVGALLLIALALLALGLRSQRKARRGGLGYGHAEKSGGVSVEWVDISYTVPNVGGTRKWFGRFRKDDAAINNDKVVLDSLTGSVPAGQMMAILGPSGAWTPQISIDWDDI
jgi:ABC-type multidrug transport system fused ATPase/permease subunit